MNNYQIQAIVITEAQIAAIAAVIAADQSPSIEADERYTESQWQEATEHWLRARISSILVDVDWHARNDFGLPIECDSASCGDAPLPHGVYCQYHAEQAQRDCDAGMMVPLSPTTTPRLELETA